MTTNAQISAQITDLLTRWNAREAQFRDWLGGAATGGPNEDGKFPLTDASGNTQNVNSPASLASTVTGPAATAVAAKDAAEDARDASASSAGASATSAEQAASDRTIARQWRDEAEVFRNEAAASQGGSSAASAVAIAARDQTLAARDVVLPARDETVEAQSEALQAAAEALVSRDAAAAFAASINPATLATKDELAAEIDAILGAVPGALDTLAELAAAMGNDPNFATTVTNALAAKAPMSHTHVPADITGLDTLLAGKAPVSHGHTMADIAGLTAALDGKSSASHGHALGDIAGLASALASKLPLTGGMVTGAFGVQDSSSNGFARIQPGSPTNTGHIEFLSSTGTRRAYVGYADANWVYMAAENGTTFYFNHRPNFNGNTPWDSGNFDPSSKATLLGDARFRDVYVSRGDGTGVIYLNAAETRYLYFNGASYHLPGAELVLNGRNVLAELDSRIRSNSDVAVDGLVKFRTDFNTSTGNSPPLQAYSNGPGGAVMAFHRAGEYAVNMGLDSDNVFRIGGWTAPAGLMSLNMSGNMSLLGRPVLRHDTQRGSGTLTISTSNPSGGSDGDIHFKV